MARVIRVQKGGVVPLRSEFREIRDDTLNGQLIQPSGVSVTILNPDGTTQTAAGSALWDSTGRFTYYWDTSALAVGDYPATVKWTYALSSAQGGATKTGAKGLILRLVNAQ